MCDFCNGNTKIDTTIAEYGLILRIDEERKDIIKIRLEQGSIGMTRPIKISYCPFCGRSLDNTK